MIKKPKIAGTTMKPLTLYELIWHRTKGGYRIQHVIPIFEPRGVKCGRTNPIPNKIIRARSTVDFYRKIIKSIYDVNGI